eukprot:2618788-Lingulodinium_polyedra.AAC.1
MQLKRVRTRISQHRAAAQATPIHNTRSLAALEHQAGQEQGPRQLTGDDDPSLAAVQKGRPALGKGGGKGAKGAQGAGGKGGQKGERQ